VESPERGSAKRNSIGQAFNGARPKNQANSSVRQWRTIFILQFESFGKGSLQLSNNHFFSRELMISREAGRQFDLNSPLTNSGQDSVSSASSSHPEHVEGERARDPLSVSAEISRVTC
jgi:hypothetical protein